MKFTSALPTFTQPVVFLSHQGRCGSTLLVQVLETTGHFTSLNEPPVFANISNDPRLQNPEIMKAVLRALTKPITNISKPFLMKTSSFSIALTPLVKDTLPNIHYYYMYREARPNIHSFLTVFFRYKNMYIYIGRSLKEFMPFLTDLQFIRCCSYGEINMELVSCLVTLLTWKWACSIRYYKDFVKQGISITPIKFEDFLKNPRQILEEIFKNVGLPFDSIGQGLTAMERDSQKSLPIASFMNKKKTSLPPLPEYDDPGMKVRCDAICDYLGVPRLDKTITL